MGVLQKVKVQRTRLQVLNLRGIGVMDDFFQLGGTSIMAARIAAMVQEESGKACTGAAVLQHRCIRPLCSALETLSDATALASMPDPLAFVGNMDAGPAVLSAGQEQMLILHSMDPKSSSYNKPLVLGLYGALDPELLSTCVQVSKEYGMRV